MSGRIESKRTDAKLISRQKRHSDSEQRVKVSMRLYDRLEASLVLEREREIRSGIAFVATCFGAVAV